MERKNKLSPESLFVHEKYYLLVDVEKEFPRGSLVFFRGNWIIKRGDLGPRVDIHYTSILNEYMFSQSLGGPGCFVVLGWKVKRDKQVALILWSTSGILTTTGDPLYRLLENFMLVKCL